MPDFDLDAALRSPVQLPEIAVRFGFSIGTGGHYDIEGNLRERGYDDGQIAFYLGPGGSVNSDARAIERNGLDILRRSFAAHDQGHSDEDLVGTCYVELGTTEWKRLREWADNDEGFTTSSGSIGALFANGPNIVYRNVSEMGCDCMDLEIRFFDLDYVKRWIAVEDGDAPMPPKYAD